MTTDMFEVPSEEEWKAAHDTTPKKVNEVELVPKSQGDIDYIINNDVDGLCLIPTEETYVKVFDYLFSLVFKYHKSIQDMIMEDSCVFSATEMKYFDKRLYGKIPSYSYWKLYFRSLPKDVADDIKITEKELLKSRYVQEMVNMAEMGMCETSGEGRLFNYWHKLHAIADKEVSRLENRVTKRENKVVSPVDRGITAAAKIIKALSDEGLLELKDKVQILVESKKDG